MFKSILLPVDLNSVETQHKAVRTAADLARSYGASLHVLTVVPDFGMTIVATFFPEGYEKEALERTNESLHEFVKQNIPAGLPVQHIVGQGSVHQEILRVAGEIDADLIVMASHRPELQDYLLGPNAAHVVRHTSRSVMIVRG